MSNPLKTAVIGVGYLGRFHAQKYAQLDTCDLIGVVDSDAERARLVGEELGVPHYTNYLDIIDHVDAVSIVVPTVHHYELVKAFVQQDIHVLVEKPFTANLEQGEELIALSQSHKVCLQVGHLERFNALFVKFKDAITNPQYIECTRVSSFPKRGTDVDVILDLMIHDLDLVLALIGEFPNRIDGIGTSVLTTKVDLANVRLEFPKGCVVNLTASRVSNKAERHMRVVQPGLYLSLNLGQGNGKKLEVDPTQQLESDDLQPKIVQLEKNDALLEEIQSFVNSIDKKMPPVVSADAGFQAMKVAWKIKEQMER